MHAPQTASSHRYSLPSATLDGPCSRSFQAHSGPARAPQSLVISEEASQNPLLQSLTFPFRNRGSSVARKLGYLRYSLDLNQQGNPLYLERLLGLKGYRRKWNSIRKATTQPDRYLLRDEPGE